MPIKIEPPGGLPLEEAFLQFTEPSTINSYEVAAAEWHRQPGRTIRGSEKWREKERAKLVHRRAFAAARANFISQLRRTELVAFAFPDAMSADGPRTRLAADRWDALQIKSWPGSCVEGGGTVFHDLRVHQAKDLREWERGATLAFALRAIAPAQFDEYQAYWSPDRAPEGSDEEERRLHGEWDRLGLWRTLWATVLRLSGAEFWAASPYSDPPAGGALIDLHALHPFGDPSATWRPISEAVLETLKDVDIDLEDSRLNLPGQCMVPVRVFLAGGMEGAVEKGEAIAASSGDNRRSASHTVGAQTRCALWLKKFVGRYPMERPCQKVRFRDKAVDKFPGLSGRGFDRVWDRVLEEDHPWKKPGAPKKKTSH